MHGDVSKSMPRITAAGRNIAFFFPGKPPMDNSNTILHPPDHVGEFGREGDAELRSVCEQEPG